MAHTPSPPQKGYAAEPSPHGGRLVVVVVGGQVDVGVVDVVVVVVVAHPPSAHASQQLAWTPTQAEPPRGAVHFAATLLTTHDVRPALVVRQQVTAPGRPQADRDAHCRTTPAQAWFDSAAFAARTAQPT